MKKKVCAMCGAIVSCDGVDYIIYVERWWRGRYVALCAECESVIPPEQETDKPRELWDFT